MNRGDIWLVDLGKKTKTRPAVVVTRQNVIPYLNKITVIEITTKGKGYPTEVFIGTEGNLPKPSFVQTDNVHTIPIHRLIRQLGTLTDRTMEKISRKIVLALQLEDCFRPGHLG